MRQWLYLSVCAAFVIVAGPAISADKQAKPDANAVKETIKQFDKNNDGALSRNELPVGEREGFKKLDKNNDGKLDAGELRDHVQRMRAALQPVEVISIWTIEAVDPVSRQELQTAYETLRQLDANNDGKISEEEVKAGREKAVARRIEAAFKRCDANNDGKLAENECEALTSSTFEQLDANNDNTVTKDEFKTAIMNNRDPGSEQR